MGFVIFLQNQIEFDTAEAAAKWWTEYKNELLNDVNANSI